MFTFDTIEKSNYGGVSPDLVPNAAMNLFSVAFGCEALDSRLQVRISERQVRFFYYDHDYKNNDYDPYGVKDRDYLKEIGFITLTRNKDAGNDILAFPQNIDNLELYSLYYVEKEDKTKGENSLPVGKSIINCIKNWKDEFYEFPFIEDYRSIEWENINNEEKFKGLFRCFARCCLLNFIYEFENRYQCFGGAPLYDIVRDNLRESDVYKMLSAKIHYKLYFYQGKNLSKNQDKYTYYTQKFADCLMDKRLNKVISPDNYGDTDDKQGWFYNPENEIKRILRKNRSQRREGGATLKESLVSKIRVFLYTKHAIFEAMPTCTSRVFFIIAQALMLLGNVLLINASLHFNNHSWDSFFRDWFVRIGVLFLVLVVSCVSLSGLINGIRQGKLSSILNTFFPRILVAEAAAWLTIGIAEDLVKSMLWVEKHRVVLCAMLLVLSLVCVIIFGETKQHSPYQRGRNVVKSLLVLNHSVFFALIMGCFMQFIFYNNLLKTSDALSEVVYKKHFKQLERQLDDMEELENSIKEYRIFAREYDFNHKRISGTNAGKTGIKGNISFYNHESLVDSAELKLENRIVMESSMVSTIGKEIHVYHNELVDDITNCAETDSDFKTITIGLKKMADDEESSVIKENLELINGHLAAKLNLEILETKNYLSYNNYDTLIRWATANIDTVTNTQSEGIRKWANEAKKNKCAMDVSLKDHYFYPNLLLFHTLIVLVLAFITQLIISDKSVTEPL